MAPLISTICVIFPTEQVSRQLQRCAIQLHFPTLYNSIYWKSQRIFTLNIMDAVAFEFHYFINRQMWTRALQFCVPRPGAHYHLSERKITERTDLKSQRGALSATLNYALLSCAPTVFQKQIASLDVYDNAASMPVPSKHPWLVGLYVIWACSPIPDRPNWWQGLKVRVI